MDSKRFYKHKLNNLIHAGLIFTGMIALVSVLGWSIGGLQGLKWLFFIGMMMLIMTPRISPHVILRLYGARPLLFRDSPRLQAALEGLTRRADLPDLPGLYYIPSRILNAFTMGKRDRAAIALTDGLIRTLDFRELIGVLAHEISHIRNNDMWIMNLSDIVSRLTSVFSMVGQFLLILNLPLLLLSDYDIPWLPILILIFAPTLTVVMQLALSRTREFDADLEAARLTGDPHGLAAALTKIEYSKRGFFSRVLFPGHRDPNPSVLRTHPDTQERVRRLLSLEEKEMQTHPLHGLTEEDIFIPDHERPPIRRTPRWRFGGIWY